MKVKSLDNFLLVTIPIVLISVVFYPLFLGKNFLPFSSYEVYKDITEKTNNCSLKEDILLSATKSNREYGLRQIDYSGISILYTMQKFIAKNYKEGKIALWDPYICGGIPTFHEGQYRPFNPFFIPFYIFPTPHMYCFSLFLGLIVGFIFMFLFLIKMGLDKISAIMGSSLFVLNPFILERISLSDHFFSYCITPLIFFLFEDALSLNIKSFLKLFLAFLLMGHSGHPEMNIIITIFATIYFLIYNPNHFLKKCFFIIYLGLFLFFSLSLYIFPLLKFYFSGFHYKEESHRLYVYTELRHFFIPSSDINLLPILLSFLIYAILKAKKKILFFLISSILSIGYFSKLQYLGSLLTKSGFTLFLPCYFKMIFWFFIATIISFGFNHFNREKIDPKILIILIMAFLLSFFLMNEAPSTLNFPLKKYFKNLVCYYLFSFVPIIFLIIKFPFFKKLNSKYLAFILTFFSILPYCYPLSVNYLFWQKCDIKSYDCIDFINQNYPHSRISAIQIGSFCALPPNYGSTLNIKQIEMNLFIFPNSIYKMLKKHFIYPTQLTFTEIDEFILKKVGVDFILLPNSIEFKDKIFKGEFFSVYKLSQKSNRIFFPEKIYNLSKNENIDYEKMNLTPSDTVWIEGLYDTQIEKPQNYKIEFLEDGFHKISINVETDKRSLLVLRDTYYDEWECYVDRKKTKIYKVDGLFRGVVIDEGKHLIEFVYRPLVVYISSMISLLFHLLFFLYYLLKNFMKKS